MNKIIGNTELKDYVTYVDTDSNYLCCDDLVKKVYGEEEGFVDQNKIADFLDGVAKKKLEPLIADAFVRLCDYTNAFENRMSMKREVIATKGLWIAKKRYVLKVLDNEGLRYSIPEVKSTGVQIVQTTTPMHCRIKLKECLNLILDGKVEEYQKLVSDFRDEFYTLNFGQIAFNRGIGTMNKYIDKDFIFTKGTTVQAKASILYNHYRIKHGLEKDIQKISEGDKIKYCYLKLPNPILHPVIGCPNETLPKEFNLDAYLDYNLMFEKTFLNPLKDISYIVGCTPEKIATLEDFF